MIKAEDVKFKPGEIVYAVNINHNHKNNCYTCGGIGAKRDEIVCKQCSGSGLQTPKSGSFTISGPYKIEHLNIYANNGKIDHPISYVLEKRGSVYQHQTFRTFKSAFTWVNKVVEQGRKK